jgi:hypothetical protein
MRQRFLSARAAQPGARQAVLTAALAAAAWAGTLTGKFILPTAGAVADGTLLLTLSQQGITSAPGYAVVPRSVACYTSTDGSVVGVPNPQTAPGGSAFNGLGTLPAGVYFVEIAYTGASATTSLVSPESRLSLTSAGELQIPPPALQPAAATGFAVYIGTSSGGETLQGTVAGFSASFTQSGPLAAGAAPPGANSSVCSIEFNDAITPSYTTYSATLEDASGAAEPGYPQSWYLAGLQADVGTIVPLASNPAVAFPQPILANPTTSTAQSLNSGLYMNGLDIEASGNVGPGFFSAYWAGALPAANTVLASWTPNVGIWVRRADLNAQAAGAGGTQGTAITVSDGTSTCTFSGLLVGAATSGSQGFPTGACEFNAGVPLTVRVLSDDHTTAPQNLSWSLELTAK